MNKMDYYKLAFSRLRASKPIHAENFEKMKMDKHHESFVEKMKTRKQIFKSYFSLAIVMICLITVGVGIFAIYKFGIGGMRILNQIPATQPQGETSTFQTTESSSINTHLTDAALIEDTSPEEVDESDTVQTENINPEIKFGLKDVLIKESPTILPAFEGASPEEIILYDPISLQGYATSAEYKAGAEWLLFKEEYDSERSILNAADNQSAELDPKYDLYLTINTQELADKLEEIITKYQLKLHTKVTFLTKEDELEEELYNQTEMSAFLGSGNIVSNGYVYDDGSFLVSCNTILPDGRTIGYQLHNTAKGIFDDAAFLNISDRNDFDEWSYMTEEGFSLQMATSSEQALIIADLNRSFTVISVLENMSQSDLKFLADSIYFSEIK